jgi:hypothetical protein
LPLRFLVLLGCRSAEVFLGFWFFFPSCTLHFLRRAVFSSECFVSAAVFQFPFSAVTRIFLLGFGRFLARGLLELCEPTPGITVRVGQCPAQGSDFLCARTGFCAGSQRQSILSGFRFSASGSVHVWVRRARVLGHWLPLHLVLIPCTARAGAATDLLWPLSTSVAFS